MATVKDDIGRMKIGLVLSVVFMLVLSLNGVSWLQSLGTVSAVHFAALILSSLARS